MAGGLQTTGWTEGDRAGAGRCAPRFESWDWDDEDDPADRIPWAGDTSGVALPRATLKLSGEAPCNICWYMELEFGHYDAYPGFQGALL